MGYLRVFEVIYSQILFCVLREFYYLFTVVPDRPLASGRASDTYAGYDGDRPGDRCHMGGWYALCVHQTVSAQTDADDLWRT